MKKLLCVMSALMATTMLMADEVQKSGNSVTIRPDGGQAKVVRLEVINDNIIRVRATSKETLPEKPASLMSSRKPRMVSSSGTLRCLSASWV